MNYFIVFVISFITVSLELFFTRMLYLKAWNHVVYLVIPFAILGYGIGANIYMIFRKRIDHFDKTTVLGVLCLMISAAILLSAGLMIKLQIRIDDLLNIFASPGSLLALAWAYTVYMIPFIFIGFLLVYIFSNHRRDISKLYFFDLIGAGISAAMFFVLIEHFAVFRSIVITAYASLVLALLVFSHKKIHVVIVAAVLFFVGLPFVPEPTDYAIDARKGWEWIPGTFPAYTYEQISSRWHPLGRTDAYRITDPHARELMVDSNPGTFQINLDPLPEFAYFSTNFLAGTPVYNFSKEGLAEKLSKLVLFSQSMEAPYVFLDKPKVLVIGAGGGRDIFMAKSHGAVEITGAEINPGIVAEMNPGGRLYDYSGRIYTADPVKVYLTDGRHLVKKMSKNSMDLIVLNGVDTFSGLSSGAYAYAESYLYTKDAFKDYLRILKADGMINLNRWLFWDMPRESLRLHAIALEALKESGAQRPWEHIIIGGTRAGDSWSIILVKKSPFTSEEAQKVFQYFKGHNVWQIYPAPEALKANPKPVLNFQTYADHFKQNTHKAFARQYPYDISVITDDNPFFYKYYKLSAFNPFKTLAYQHHTGPVIFLTQLVVFAQSLIFIVIFILLPLFIFKKNDIRNFPQKTIRPFVVYFGCLGAGYMFIEISSMQRFVLLLGSPIHSITVVLSSLLIATGLGSMSFPKLEKHFRSRVHLLASAAFVLMAYAITQALLGTGCYDRFMSYGFWVRVLGVAIMVAPAGFLLGLFFPAGLQVVSRNSQDAIAWAWGINGAFSVLGSILSIILAQFSGFSAVLLLGGALYLGALLAFIRLDKRFSLNVSLSEHDNG